MVSTRDFVFVLGASASNTVIGHRGRDGVCKFLDRRRGEL